MKIKRSFLVRKNKTYREIFKIYGLGFFMSLMFLLIAYQFVEPAPPKSLVIATGGSEGAYYAFGRQYRQFFLKEGINLKVLKTTGSVENLKLLKEKKVDVAFVQGGIGNRVEYPQIKGLASLYLEPLWIFVRKGVELTTLSDLEGKRIGVGVKGSGTRKIAMQLLEDNNLIKNNKVEVFSIGGMEGVGRLLSKKIDALFIVTTESSPLLQKLFIDPRIDLVNLKRSESYTRLHHYLSSVVLPEGVLDMEDNIPRNPLHLIAPAATLVVNEELHPALADLFMQVITKVHRDNSILSTGKKFPSPENLDFPLSKEAERFYRNGTPFLQRYLPFWAASLIDRMKVMLLPLVALILPLTKILPPTYRWRMRSRIYRWYEELHGIDLYVKENADSEMFTEAIAILDTMEHEVREVEVPLSYAEELYNLRLHIDLLRKQLTVQQKEF